VEDNPIIFPYIGAMARLMGNASEINGVLFVRYDVCVGPEWETCVRDGLSVKVILFLVTGLRFRVLVRSKRGETVMPTRRVH